MVAEHSVTRVIAHSDNSKNSTGMVNTTTPGVFCMHAGCWKGEGRSTRWAHWKTHKKKNPSFLQTTQPLSKQNSMVGFIFLPTFLIRALSRNVIQSDSGSNKKQQTPTMGRPKVCGSFNTSYFGFLWLINTSARAATSSNSRPPEPVLFEEDELERK